MNYSFFKLLIHLALSNGKITLQKKVFLAHRLEDAIKELDKNRNIKVNDSAPFIDFYKELKPLNTEEYFKILEELNDNSDINDLVQYFFHIYHLLILGNDMELFNRSMAHLINFWYKINIQEIIDLLKPTSPTKVVNAKNHDFENCSLHFVGIRNEKIIICETLPAGYKCLSILANIYNSIFTINISLQYILIDKAYLKNKNFLYFLGTIKEYKKLEIYIHSQYIHIDFLKYFREKKLELKINFPVNNNLTIHSIEAKDISCGYKKNSNQTKNVNFKFESKTLNAIIGPSGSGKSTLFRAILGKNYINDGILKINGIPSDTKKFLEYIGYVKQHEVLIKGLDIYDNIYYYHKLTSRETLPDEIINKKITSLLQKLGIEDLRHRIFNPDTLSGGEKKKVNLAMELIRNPDLILIDEPTSGLSSIESLHLIEMLSHLAKTENKIIVTIIHQPTIEMLNYYDDILLLNKEGYNIFTSSTYETLSMLNYIVNDMYLEESESKGMPIDPKVLLEANHKTENFWNILKVLKGIN